MTTFLLHLLFSRGARPNLAWVRGSSFPPAIRYVRHGGVTGSPITFLFSLKNAIRFVPLGFEFKFLRVLDVARLDRFLLRDSPLITSALFIAAWLLPFFLPLAGFRLLYPGPGRLTFYVFSDASSCSSRLLKRSSFFPRASLFCECWPGESVRSFVRPPLPGLFLLSLEGRRLVRGIPFCFFCTFSPVLPARGRGGVPPILVEPAAFLCPLKCFISRDVRPPYCSECLV